MIIGKEGVNPNQEYIFKTSHVNWPNQVDWEYMFLPERETLQMYGLKCVDTCQGIIIRIAIQSVTLPLIKNVLTQDQMCVS